MINDFGSISGLRGQTFVPKSVLELSKGELDLDKLGDNPEFAELLDKKLSDIGASDFFN